MKEGINMNEIFNSYKLVLPQLKEMLQEDISIALCDTTKIIKNYAADSFSIPGNEGDILKHGEPIWEAINQNKLMVGIVPKEYYGFSFQAISYPIRDKDGHAIGCVAIGKDLTNKINFEESTESLFATLEQTNAIIQELNQGSKKLFSIINDIVKSVKESEKSIQKNAEIVKSIHDIATQSNLLGLNAAIEASRAGEFGRGFSVVATEMRKLAHISKQSADNVSKDLEEMKKNMDAVLEIVDKAVEVSKSQNLTTKEISSALEEITRSSEKIVTHVKEL